MISYAEEGAQLEEVSRTYSHTNCCSKAFVEINHH